MAGQNRLISDLSAKGLRAADLVGDVPERTDGAIWVPSFASLALPQTGTAWSQVRQATGDYRLQRTATGAETHQVAFALAGVCRRTPASGMKVLAFQFAYSVATVDATSVDLTIQKTVYADRAVPVVSSFGGSITYDSNHNTSGLRKASASGDNPHLLTGTLFLPQYQSTSPALVTAELVIVLPNTCVFTIYSGGFLVALS